MKNKIKQGFYATEVRSGLAIFEVKRKKAGYTVEIEFDNHLTQFRSWSDNNFSDFAKTKQLLEIVDRSIYLGKP
jgi:hypothetical protein